MSQMRTLTMIARLNGEPPRTGRADVDRIIAKTWDSMRRNLSDREIEKLAAMVRSGESREALNAACRAIVSYLFFQTADRSEPKGPGPFDYGTNGGKRVVRKGHEMS